MYDRKMPPSRLMPYFLFQCRPPYASDRYRYALSSCHWPRPGVGSLRGVIVEYMPSCVINRPRTLPQWKSPPMPSCWSCTSLVRPDSEVPTNVWSIGLLNCRMKLTSARNSPVKYEVLIGESFVRAFPLSHVKSANANGSGFLLVVSALQPACAPANDAVRESPAASMRMERGDFIS